MPGRGERADCLPEVAMNPICNRDPTRRQSRQQRGPVWAPHGEGSWAMAGVPRRQWRQQPASIARLRGKGRAAVSDYSRAVQGPAGETPWTRRLREGCRATEASHRGQDAGAGAPGPRVRWPSGWVRGSFTCRSRRGLDASLGLAELGHHLFMDRRQQDGVAPLGQRPTDCGAAAPTICWEEPA